VSCTADALGELQRASDGGHCGSGNTVGAEGRSPQLWRLTTEPMESKQSCDRVPSSKIVIHAEGGFGIRRVHVRECDKSAALLLQQQALTCPLRDGSLGDLIYGSCETRLEEGAA
jgi:hypothetical protein